MKIISQIVIAAFLMLAINSFAKAQVNPQDRQALIDLYNSTDGSNWINSTNWLTDDVSTWFGVTVSDNRVTRIILANNNLNGTIPPSLANLTNLYFLNLGFNNLFDTIPFSLCNLINLQYFFLNVNNNISGVIPPNIGNLTNLIRIDLSFNQLSGTIPASFSNCLSLQNLYLENNMLTGTIPESLGNLTNLQNVFLDDNQLSGSIPASLSNLTYLPRLWLYDNQFTFAGMEGIVNIAPGSSYGTLNNIYAPQATIPLYNNNNILSVSVGGTPANNTFKWYKDSVLVATKVRDSTYTATSNGTYWAVSTNSVATQLTLYSDTLKIDNFGIPPPSILSFTPNGGCPGTSTPVLILGTNFIGVTSVTVGGAAVDSFTVNSARSITAYISNGTTGKIVVTTPNGTATSDSVFTFGKGYTAFAYITNYSDGTVSVVNTATNTVATTITVGSQPWGVSITPDGTKAYVSNAGSNTVSVINTATNVVTATIPVGNFPEGIAFSPDGATAYVTNYYSHTVSVINTATNSVTTTVGVGTGPYCISLTPDGTKAYVTNANYGNNGTVSVINTATNTVVATITVGLYPVGVSVSPDGTKAYVTNTNEASIGTTFSVINTATNTVTKTVTVGNWPIGVSFTPDGTKAYVVNDSSNTVSVINAVTDTVMSTFSVGYFPEGISFSPDGTKAFITNGGSNSVSVINTATNAVIATVAVGNNPHSLGNFIANVPTPCTTPPSPSILSFTPNGTCPGVSIPVFITGTNLIGTTAVTVGGAAVDSFKVNDSTSITAYISKGTTGKIAVTSPNGTATSDSVFTFGLGHTAYAYVANLDDGTVSVINTTIDKVVATIPVGANPWGVSASADGTRVYVTNVGNNVMVNGTVSVINTATNTVIATVTVGRVPYGICVSPDGQRVYVTNLYYNSLTGIDSVSVINTATYQVIATIPVGNNPYGVSTSPDGTKLFVADSIVRIINTATNTVIAAVPVGGEGTEVAVSPDGSKVYVSVANDSTLVVINSANYSMMATDSVGYNPYGVCISPDGTKVYVANQQDSITLTVVNTITNKAIATVAGGYEPDDISITPDGTKVYMPNPIDNTVHVINTATNAVIAIIPVGNTPYAFGNFIANVPNPTPCSLPPPPIITSFNTPACPGTIDTIKGNGFTGATSVTFGGNAASSFKVINDSTITAVVDSGESGSVTVTTPNGSDSLAGFVYNKPTSSITTKSICAGSSYTFNGATHDTAGTFISHLTNIAGCDSSATLILTLKDSSVSTTTKAICADSSYTFNGTTYKAAGNYTVHLTNAIGCDSIATLILTVDTASILYGIAGANQVCINDTITLTNLTQGGIWSSLYPSIAQINDSGIVTGLSVGVDTIHYSTLINCKNETVSQPIQVLGAKPLVDPSITTVSCLNPQSGSISIAVSGPESPYYVSYGGNTYDAPYTAYNLGVGGYTFIVTNGAGCPVDTLTNVTVGVSEDASCDTLFVPSGFVPSSTDANDRILKPFGGLSTTIHSITFKVYNRFGSLVFISHDLTSGWDGTINGTLQDTGTYVWYLEYTKGTTGQRFIKGTSTLIR